MGNQAHTLQFIAGRPTNAAQATDYLIASALKMQASDLHLGVNHALEAIPEPYLHPFSYPWKAPSCMGPIFSATLQGSRGRLKVLAGLKKYLDLRPKQRSTKQARGARIVSLGLPAEWPFLNFLWWMESFRT